MVRTRDTGFPAADAQDDFLRARRRQALSRVGRGLSRASGDVDLILPFDEVVAALGRVGERTLGLEVVALETVLGTVDRTHGFDRQFRPTSRLVRARWEGIANAMRRGEAMPPVLLYRIGEVHFVRDGHHRVSVARAMGLGKIDAYVTEVRTRVGAERSLTVADLPLKSHERVFLERVPLPSPARERVKVSDAWDYARLAEGVEAWGFRLMQDRCELLDRAGVAQLWFAEEYAPVVELLREARLLDPGDASVTETDLYMRAAEERYRLLRTHAWSPEVIARLRSG